MSHLRRACGIFLFCYFFLFRFLVNDANIKRPGFNTLQVATYKIVTCDTGDHHVFSRSDIKVTKKFFVTSNLEVTARITINYYRSNFFLK